MLSNAAAITFYWFKYAFSHVRAVLGSPIPNNNTSFEQPSGTWAQVVANVAPLMALLGERNAKEYIAMPRRGTNSYL